MSRVLLVCPEPLGHGRPAGIGIRFVEMSRVLRAAGHEVSILARDAAAVEGCRTAAISPQTLRDFSDTSDVIVVQGHVANDVFAHCHRRPTVVDLYDPYIVENLHYFAERGREVFAHDHATLMNSLVNGDFFLCASEAQRQFYLGALLATGRLNPVVFQNDPRLESLIAIAPFGVLPPRPAPVRDLVHPAILFGGIYDWYDPIAAIDAVAIARVTSPALTLTFTTHANPDLTPQGKAAEAIAYVRRKNYDFVRFVPWKAYDQRASLFDSHTAALLTFPQSLETDLAMRTRIYDYLWGSLPIITSSAPGTDEILARYDAGIVIHDGSADAFAGAIVSLLNDGTRYAAMISGTQAFVHDHQWETTLAPLVSFCRNPKIDAARELFVNRPALSDQSPTVLERIKRRIGGRF